MEAHRIFETQDGTRSLFSERFGVSYHSKFGAWQETQHVFIDAGLRYCAVDRKQLSILDVGYGTGLNAAATLLLSLQRPLAIDYVALEAFPVPPETLLQLDYPTALGWSAAEAAAYDALQSAPWQDDFSVISPRFRIQKRQQHFEELVDVAAFDLIYYDAFAPSAQPELWTPEIFGKMFCALRQNGVLVTYCAKGQVKRDLRAVGFEVERLQGPPGKREMTRCTKP